jgi:hypothetical protein
MRAKGSLQWSQRRLPVVVATLRAVRPRERRLLTSQGHPHAILRRALDPGNLVAAGDRIPGGSTSPTLDKAVTVDYRSALVATETCEAS